MSGDIENVIRDLFGDVDKAKLVLYHDMKNIKQQTDEILGQVQDIADNTAKISEIIDEKIQELEDRQYKLKATLSDIQSALAGHKDTIVKHNQNIKTLDDTITKATNNIQNSINNLQNELKSSIKTLQQIEQQITSASKTFTDVKNMLYALIGTNALLILYILYTLLTRR